LSRPDSSASRVRLRPTLHAFPYTTLFRSADSGAPDRRADARSEADPDSRQALGRRGEDGLGVQQPAAGVVHEAGGTPDGPSYGRSEEHTSELQSRFDLVCRLLLGKKKNHI